MISPLLQIVIIPASDDGLLISFLVTPTSRRPLARPSLVSGLLSQITEPNQLLPTSIVNQ